MLRTPAPVRCPLMLLHCPNVDWRQKLTSLALTLRNHHYKLTILLLILIATNRRRGLAAEAGEPARRGAGHGAEEQRQQDCQVDGGRPGQVRGALQTRLPGYQDKISRLPPLVWQAFQPLLFWYYHQVDALLGGQRLCCHGGLHCISHIYAAHRGSRAHALMHAAADDDSKNKHMVEPGHRARHENSLRTVVEAPRPLLHPRSLGSPAPLCT